MRLLQILMVSLIVLVIAGYAYGEDDPILPYWFWDIPVNDNALLAVGYSNAYIESDHAFNEAFDDAVLRLFIDMNCQIKGERATATSPSGTMHMGSTIQVSKDTLGLAEFKLQVIMLDSVRTPEMLIILVSNKEMEINHSLIKQPPEPYVDNAVSGSAPIYLQQSSSWIEAERVAREELALSKSASVKVVDRKENNNVIKTIVTTTDVMLSDVQTIHQRIDWDNRIVKVWVRD
jgi:hypothetical protein